MGIRIVAQSPPGSMPVSAAGRNGSLSFTGAVALWAVVALLLVLRGIELGYRGPAFLWAAVVLVVLLAGEILPAANGVLQGLQRRIGAFLPALIPLWLAILYGGYLLGTGQLNARLFLAGLAYLELPVLLCVGLRGRAPGHLLDYLAVLALWMPVELRFAHRFWTYPPTATHILVILAGVNVAVGSFLLLRGLDGVGYRVDGRPAYGRTVGLHFLTFAALAIPLGEVLHFIHFSPSWVRLRAAPQAALGILFFTAWPEELLFRGLLQNLLSRTLRSTTAGWLAASVVFGLSHINNGPFPNWRYVLLASLAGLFYGRVWSRTGSLLPAALLHALVDVTWHTLF